MIRLLTFTNLYPSRERPRHGIFVEQRLRRLVETGHVGAHVVVPCARRPLARAPQEGRNEMRFGLDVSYTGFPVVPGVTSCFHPLLMYRGARRAVARWSEQGLGFDIVDGQFLYPDGVAAAHLARSLKLPLVLTARGSDVNVAMDERIAGRSIHWAISQARIVIAVSEALRNAMITRGVPPAKVVVVRNGVDLQTFVPYERAAARGRLGLEGPMLLSVGNLVPEKGHTLTLAALSRMPDARLVLIGSGPEEADLRRHAQALGIADRVTWLAPLPQAELAAYYSAADVTVLASTREGMPNVLLESLACGTPVVAARVGGTPEILGDPVAGRLLPERTPEALVHACREVLAQAAAQGEVRRYAELFGWDAPVAQQILLLQGVMGSA